MAIGNPFKLPDVVHEIVKMMLLRRVRQQEPNFVYKAGYQPLCFISLDAFQ